MNRARGTIVWLFGADGVGKTRLAERLANSPLDVVSVFNGTHPETWPDGGSYVARMALGGIDDATNRDPRHYRDKMRHCYNLAGTLASGGAGVVIIDSCPRGKTILNRTADAIRAGEGAWYAAATGFDEAEQVIRGSAGSIDRVNHVGVHVTLPQFGTEAARGAVLLDRLHKREGGFSEFDPQTAVAAGQLLVAGDTLESVLSTQGDICVRVESLGVVDERIVASQILSQIPQAA